MTIKKKIYIFLLILLNLIICSKNGFTIENKILFKIDNEIITTIDISEEIKYLKILNNELVDINSNQIFEISKKSLIKHKIKKIELQKYFDDLNIEDKILDKLLIDYFGKKFGVNSVIDLENFFKNLKINPNTVKEKIIIDLLWKQLVYEKFKEKVFVDKKLIKKELEDKQIIKEFLLSEIVFELKENENLENKFKEINKTIKNYNFSKAANMYSISDSANSGGMLGWISEASMNKKIREEIFKSKNNITKPIVIPGGFLVLKIEDQRNVKKTIDLEKQIKIISDKKINQQLERYSVIYINKIKKNIKIYEL